MQQTSTVYHVKTEAFEGPIELLLRLIEQRKLPINEVSLAQVTDDYIARIRGFASLPLGDVTQFIVVASTLVLIKSKSLLPLLQLSEEEEQDIDELERRLRMYKTFQDVSEKFQSVFGERPSFSRPYVSREVVFSPDKKMTSENFVQSLRDVFATLPPKERLHEKAVAAVIRIEDVMDRLIDRVQVGIQLSFNAFAGKGRVVKTAEEKKAFRTEIAVGFLAMLEMARNGMIELLQNSNFEDIMISKN